MIGHFSASTTRNAASLAFAFAFASTFALAQPKPDQPDAGRILEQQRQPLRLPPPAEPVLPKPPEPRPALPVSPQLRVKVEQFTFSGNTLFSETQLQPVVQEFVGKELDFEGLNEAATKVRAFYRGRGYFLAQAYLPQQAIRAGRVEIAVIEGRIGEVELDQKPSVRISQNLLAGILGAHLKQGQVITETGLERPLLIINDLPGAQVTSEIRPSRTIGAADLRVNVDQTVGRFNGYVDYDNYGNRFTGEHRFGASLNWNTPFGYGDQASFRGFITDETMWFTRFAYLIPVGYYGTRVGVSYSKFEYHLEKDFATLKANGEGEVRSVYAFQPIIRTRNTNLILQVSYEDKQLDDRVESTNSFERRDISASKVGFVGDFRDQFLGGGLNAYSGTFTHGNLGISPQSVLNTDQTTGHHTEGNWNKWNVDLRRLQRITERMNLLASFSGQRAMKNLASAEKVSLGGPNGVRAYPAGEATADTAMITSAELRYLLPGQKAFDGDVTVSAFWDYGWAKINQEPNATDFENTRSISGVGLGFSAGREGDFIIRISSAVKTSADPARADTARRVPRTWIQAIKWF